MNKGFLLLVFFLVSLSLLVYNSIELYKSNQKIENLKYQYKKEVELIRQNKQKDSIYITDFKKRYEALKVTRDSLKMAIKLQK